MCFSGNEETELTNRVKDNLLQKRLPIKMLFQALGIWCGCMLEALLGKNEELKGVFIFFACNTTALFLFLMITQ